MVQVQFSNNVTRKTMLISEDTTVRQALEANGINYTTGRLHLDGAPLQAGDIDKTFASFGISEKCYLTSVVKADNA